MFRCIADVGFGATRLPERRMHILLARGLLLRLLFDVFMKALRRLACGSREGPLLLARLE